MEIKIEDLMLSCDACHGSGQVEAPSAHHNQGSFGRRVLVPTLIHCEKCHGKGFKLTEAGTVLRDFFRDLKTRQLI